MRHSLRILSILLSLFVLISCDSTPEIPENDPGFSDYIAAHTAGVVSSSSSVQFHLMQDFNPGVEPGTAIEAELIEFEPKIEGTLIWADASTIVFTPAEPLQSGESYAGKFHLGALMEVPSALQTFEFLIQVIEQDFSVLSYQLNSMSNTDTKLNKLEGVVQSADVSNIDELSESITFSGLDGLTAKWETTNQTNRFTFTIDSVERREEGYEVEADFKGEVLETMRIPGLAEFTVINVSVEQSPQQLVRVSFSDPLKTGQATQGLFTLNGQDVTSVHIEGSVATLYPSSRLNGEVPLIIREGVKNAMGYSFPKDFTTTVQFEARKPEIKFVDDGNIVPMTGKVSIPFQAVGLKAVDVRVYKIYTSNVHQFLQVNSLDGSNELRRVARPIHQQRVDLTGEGINYSEWTSFAIDLDKMIQRDPGAIYRIELSFRKSYSLYPCSEDETNAMSTSDDGGYEPNPDQFYAHYNDYYYVQGYDYRERDNPCHVSYYNSSRIIRKNVLATDLGLIVKGNDGDYEAYVTSLTNATGISGAEVVFFNYQGLEIAKATTNGDGVARINLDGVPFRAEARKGGQRAYLTLETSRALSVSNFDVSGVDVSDGIQAFMYGERGVWRPGDTVFLNAILNDKANPLPENHPLTLTVFNPEGKQIYRTTARRGTNTIFDFPFVTSREALTGSYRAQLTVGGKSFTKYLSIETILPNRYDIEVEATDEVVVAGTQSYLDVHAEWLTGAKASGAKVTMEGRLTRDYGAFSEFEGYTFFDQTRDVPNLSNHQFFDGSLDQEGNARVLPQLGNLRYAPGMLRLNIGTRVFEPGGRFSINSTSVQVAPFTSFVGVKMPETNDYGYLETEKKHTLQIRTLTPKGELTDGQVRVTISRVHWSWWWSARRGRSTYLNSDSKELIQSQTIEVEGGKGQMTFEIADNYWGRMLVEVEDLNSGHRTTSLAYIDWGYGRDRSGRGGGESVSILNVQTDKEKYNVGDVAKISVPSSAGGRLVLSIEDGTHQLMDKFVQTKDGMTVYELKITEEMAPNVFAHAMVIQPHDQTANDLPIRLYGIVPIMVEDPATHLTPVIEAPEKVRPESTFDVIVSEKDGKEMEYTIALVDEGLLGLTGFQTPDPWKYFYAKRSLGVRTWDMYDLVMNSFSGKIARMLAVGGDAALNPENEQNADRFKPVVIHLGPFKLNARQTAKHTVTIPNYIGRLRVMVVAGSDEEAYGQSFDNIRVVQPLMAQLTLPRVLGPGEHVSIPVTVFAMENNIRDVEVKLNTTGNLRLTDGTQRVRFTETGQKTIYFEADVPEALGLAKVTMVATSGRERSTDEIEISVRSPLQMQTQEFIIDVDKNETVEHAAAPFGVGESNSLVVEISSLPSVNLGDRLNYLIGYPHGCLEQTTSKCFAQLYLADWVELTTDQKGDAERFIREGIAKLRRMQMPSGGFRYWPSSNGADPWGSTYAGHFIIAAEKVGYNLPAGMKDGYLRFASQQAKSWNSSSYYTYNNDFNQAYRLYVLALAGKPEIGAMNRLRNKSTVSRQAALRLAAAFALVNEPEIAKEILAKEWSRPDANYYYYCYGSSTRDLAMQLETMNAIGNRSEALRLSRELAEKLNEGYQSTQSIAYSLFSLGQIYKESSSKLEVDVTINGELNQVNTDNAVVRIPIEDFETVQNIKVTNLRDAPIYARILRSGVPHYGEEVPYSDRVDMTISYIDPNTNAPLDVSKLKIGTPIRAVVVLNRQYSSRDYDNLALTQIFPSGWEISNQRMMVTSGTGGNNLDYQDIRDDRVLSYFSMYRSYNSTVTITVDLTATYPGKWYLPPTTLEAMYNDAVKASNAGRWVEVVNE